MARCEKCGAEAAEPTRFCASCGSRFVPRAEPISVDGDPGAFYCYKHKKDVTRVTCGRCEKPICHRCTVISSAGVRCPQCAKGKAPVRLRGVMHDAASTVGRSVGRVDGRQVWYLYIISMIVRFFTGFFR